MREFIQAYIVIQIGLHGIILTAAVMVATFDWLINIVGKAIK